MRAETVYEQKKFWFKIKLTISIISLWWLVGFFKFVLNFSFTRYALNPLKVEKWYTIFTYPFIHANFEHLSNNSLSAFIIFSALFLIYEKISLKVLFLIYLISGIILWFIGGYNSLHIGASSIIYGVAFFLFFSGIIIQKSANIALSLFLVLWYGSMIWGITPFTVEPTVSWQGHLSGAIIGVILAFWYQKNEKINESTPENNSLTNEDFHFFEKFPLDY